MGLVVISSDNFNYFSFCLEQEIAELEMTSNTILNL